MPKVTLVTSRSSYWANRSGLARLIQPWPWLGIPGGSLLLRRDLVSGVVNDLSSKLLCDAFLLKQAASLANPFFETVRRVTADGGCNVVPKILAVNLCFHKFDPVFLYLKSETI